MKPYHSDFPIRKQSKMFNQLNSREQFWWGVVGGAIIVFYRVYAFANFLPDGSPVPNVCFKTCLQCGSGFVCLFFRVRGVVFASHITV